MRQEKDDAAKRRAYTQALRAEQASEEIRGFVTRRRNPTNDLEGKWFVF
jgi:hypothetical protein